MLKLSRKSGNGSKNSSKNMASSYKLRDIFNMDATGLFYGYVMEDGIQGCG
jgi:hypothetical protein